MNRILGFIIVYLILIVSTFLGVYSFYKKKDKKSAITLLIYDIVVITVYTIILIIF